MQKFDFIESGEHDHIFTCSGYIVKIKSRLNVLGQEEEKMRCEAEEVQFF